MDKFVLKAPYQPTGDRGACKRVQGRQSMPDFTGGCGFWKDVYDGQRDRAVAETHTGHCPQ